jgi:hypothetical protein
MRNVPSKRATPAVLIGAFVLAMLLPMDRVFGQTKAIAKLETNDPDVSIEINELKRGEGDTLTLRGVVLNRSGGKYNFPERSYVSSVYLLDLRGGKKYTVLRTNDQSCLCEPDYQTEGKATRFWAKFTAPPDSVTSIGLYWGKFEPIDAVPITK